MSTREKRLLILFGIAGFLVLNFIGFNIYKTQQQAVAGKLSEARQKLQRAEIVNASREQVAEDMVWLSENEPEPADGQIVQTKLYEFCDSEAKSQQLTVKNQRPMPTDASDGRNYHRAKFQFTLTGKEENLYRWLHRVNMPTDFRVATQIRLNPNKEDDTLIDCVAVVEQWFVPLPPSE